MRKTKKALASLAIAGMVLSMAPMSVFGATTSTRLAGDTRVDTAIAIAVSGWTTSDSVIVVPANDENMVDALAAAPLAGQLNAPILVTDKGALDPKVQQKIADLKAKNVYAIGALSDTVVNSLKATGATVTPLKGADRTETAALVAKQLTKVNGTFVVAYDGKADALSAASYAAANGYSVVIENPDGTVPANETVVAPVYTVGGQATYAGATKLAGADRYATNDAVNKGLTFQYDKVYVANGESLIDALAGSSLAAKTKSPIVLADATHAATGVNASLTATSQVIALGGAGAVSDSVLGQVAQQAPATLAVQGVSAINATTLEVTLGRAATADEQAAAKFAVTKVDSDNNKVTLTMTATFSTDGTKVDLTTGGNLMKGTYTVTASGVTLTSGKESASATVDAQKVGKIQVLASKMITSGANTATVPYKVFDQYGTEITKAALANSLTWTSSLGTAADNNAGIVTIDKGSAMVNTDTATVTGVDSATGVSASQNLTWASVATINNVAFGTQVLPTGKTTVQTAQNPAVSIPITVTDEFGNAIKTASQVDTSAGSYIQWITTDGAVTVNLDGNNNPQVNLDTTSVTDAKTITVTAIVKATGKSYSTTVSVVKPAAPASVAFGSFSDTVAAGDSSLVLPITVTDQFGNVMSADDVVSAGGITVTSSNSTVINGTNLGIASSGTNKGNVILTTGTIGAKGTTVVTVTVNATGKSTSITIPVVDARYPATMTLPSTFATNFIGGATYQFAADYNDQYSKEYTSALGTQAAYKVNTTLTQLSGDAGALTINNSGDIDTQAAQGSNYYTLTSAAGKVGTYKLAVKLIDVASGSTLSEVDKTLTVVKNNLTGLTYSVSDIPTIPGDANYTNASTEARQIKVTATDAGGATYAVPTSSIYNVVSSDTSVAAVGVGDGTTNSASKYFVWGKDITTNNTANKTATVTVYLNTDNGVQTFTKTVTVSPAAPVYQSIGIFDKVVKDRYTVDPLAKTITEFNYANRAGATTGTTAYVYGLDQYGVYTLLGGGSAVALTPSDATRVNTKAGVTYSATNGFVFDGVSKFELAEASLANVNYSANKDLYMTLFAGNAATTIKVKITAEEAPTVSGGTLVGAADTAGETILTTASKTLTFSESLNASGKAAVEAALKAGVTGATGADLGLVWTVNDTTLTITNNAAGTATFAAAANLTATLTDLAGNQTTGAILATY